MGTNATSWAVLWPWCHCDHSPPAPPPPPLPTPHLVSMLRTRGTLPELPSTFTWHCALSPDTISSLKTQLDVCTPLVLDIAQRTCEELFWAAAAAASIRTGSLLPLRLPLYSLQRLPALSSAVVTAAGSSNTRTVQANFCFFLFVDIHIKELQQKERERREQKKAVQENEIKICKGSWKHLQDLAPQYTAGLIFHRTSTDDFVLLATCWLHPSCTFISSSFFLYVWHFLLRSRCCTTQP